jgi:hypothetical protein
VAGVADGVGGWAQYGVDPGLMAKYVHHCAIFLTNLRRLMLNANNFTESELAVNPLDILEVCIHC